MASKYANIKYEFKLAFFEHIQLLIVLVSLMGVSYSRLYVTSFPRLFCKSFSKTRYKSILLKFPKTFSLCLFAKNCDPAVTTRYSPECLYLNFSRCKLHILYFCRNNYIIETRVMIYNDIHDIILWYTFFVSFSLFKGVPCSSPWLQ